jgi:hypothetical protein
VLVLPLEKSAHEELFRQEKANLTEAVARLFPTSAFARRIKEYLPSGAAEKLRRYTTQGALISNQFGTDYFGISIRTI